MARRRSFIAHTKSDEQRDRRVLREQRERANQSVETVDEVYERLIAEAGLDSTDAHTPAQKTQLAALYRTAVQSVQHSS